MARYEYDDGKSSKFWQIAVSGSSVTTTWGRIGTDGQSKTKDLGSPAKAKAEHDKLVAAKTKKGYVAAKKNASSKTNTTATKKKTAAKPTSQPSADGWQRYELVAGRSKKFWEVRVVGSAYETRYGRIGDEGKVTSKDAASAIAARRSAEKVAATKVAKGYELVAAGNLGVASRVKSNPSLEKEITKHPDEPDAYLVYGDWLQAEADDPRGELIGVQARLVDDESNKALRSAEKKLLEKNVEHFFGPPHSEEGSRWNRTFDKPKREKRRYGGWRRRRAAGDVEVWTYGYFDTVWHCGFVRSLSFSPGYYADGEGPTKSSECVAILSEFLAHPSCRFLRSLSIGDIWLNSYEGPDMTWAAEAVAASPVAGTLEELRFVGGDHDISGVSGDYGPLVKTCKNLKHLQVYGNFITVGKPDYPKLESFSVFSGGLPGGTVRAIANGKWPKLTELDIMFGRDEYGASGSVKDIAPILAGTGLSKLKRLGLKNAEFTNDIAAALIGAKVLKQLDHLDLSLGTLTPEGARVIADNKKKFAHLKTLNLDENFIDSGTQKELADLGPEVSMKGQDDDLDWVYASVGE